MTSIVNNFFYPSYQPTHACEDALEEIDEYITQDNLEHFEPHHESISEATELNKEELLEVKEEAFLSLGANTMGAAIGMINIDEGVAGIKTSSKNEDGIGFVNSFFRSFKGIFELIEKGLSSSKSFFEGSRLFSLNGASSVIVGSTILAGASGASLSLLGLTTMSLLEKHSFVKKHKDLLEKGSKDPTFSLQALQALKNELEVSKEEQQSVLDALVKPFSTLDKCKKALMGFFHRDPFMKACKDALSDPGSQDLKTLAKALPAISENIFGSTLSHLDFPKTIETLSNDEKSCFLKVLAHVYAHALKNYHEKKVSTFAKIFGEEVKDSLEKITKENPISQAETKEVLKKASENLSRELERSFIKLFGALLVAAVTVLTQISTQGAYYIVETALCLIVSACSLIAEIYAIIKCIQSQKLSLKEKIKTTALSLMMIFLITSSAMILRLTLSPIATGILTVAWLTLTCYTVYLWLSKKSPTADHKETTKEKNALDVLDKLC
jgi:hypothetical protein